MRPVILIIPGQQQQGVEFADASLSLSNRYVDAIYQSGGAPIILPILPDPALISDMVETCDGVLLTGGDDLNPELYGAYPAPSLRKTLSPVDQNRDYVELLVVNEVFRVGKPLLAICRGHQLLNVALGGTLLVDIPKQIKNHLDHKALNRKNDPVHEINLIPGSLIQKISKSSKIWVNSSHHQAVEKLAPALQSAGTSPDGIVEVIELKPENAKWLPFLLGVQFHPERMCDRHPEHRYIFDAFVAACVAESTAR